ncbi:hypothetical protein ELE36_11835 [Pseudolysobacter antarcticus]|uniref:Uncharacterized protein n=1 Tax=Pseudolysobacter antarcticus TaxID=2511995 RepID=A0A411HKD3_9GAMM|nr:hypothetical protein [Pseudolysobacter antarcticus]QBB70982.1 hypothetical protein ELE36_11835 [Pseudolysobacter antarcticus]
MQANDVPMKTAAGHREIGQRAHKLSPRSRSMLIMIHGDQTVAEISHNMRSLGDTAAIFSELAGLGLIVAEPADVQVHAAGAGNVAANDIVPVQQQAKQLLNESAVAALGLLGSFSAFRFTLKLEHCYSADDLREIIPEYRRIVSKAKGEEFANAVIRRVNALLAHA